MLSYFKSQQPQTVVVFILTFFVLKIPFLIASAQVPVTGIQYFWGSVGLLLSKSFLLNFILAQLCIFVQAIWFNYLFHEADYHEGSSMIPALYFTLATSLIPQFNELSIYLLIGFVLLLMLQTFLSITVKESTKLECFNTGILGGLLCIINLHFILFIPFLFLILYAIKPFRFNEYLMLFFGILFPVYLALAISYLCDFLININAVSPLLFHFTQLYNNIPDYINLLMTVIYLLFSFISLRGIMYSTGFKRRKNLNMLIFFFVGMVFTILFSGDLDETVFSLLLIPVSIFLSLFMLRIRKKRLGEILNAIFVLTILIVNIVRIFK